MLPCYRDLALLVGVCLTPHLRFGAPARLLQSPATLRQRTYCLSHGLPASRGVTPVEQLRHAVPHRAADGEEEPRQSSDHRKRPTRHTWLFGRRLVSS